MVITHLAHLLPRGKSSSSTSITTSLSPCLCHLQLSLIYQHQIGAWQAETIWTWRKSWVGSSYPHFSHRVLTENAQPRPYTCIQQDVTLALTSCFWTKVCLFWQLCLFQSKEKFLTSFLYHQNKVRSKSPCAYEYPSLILIPGLGSTLRNQSRFKSPFPSVFQTQSYQLFNFRYSSSLSSWLRWHTHHVYFS